MPTVSFMREFSYLLIGRIVGAKNPRVTVGSGRELFNFNILGLGNIDVRRNYHIISWFSFDELRNDNKFLYASLYASPIVINVVIGLILNYFLSHGYLQDYATFFDRFIFYIFFYVLLDTIPMTTINGLPNNGKIIYDMLKHGKRIDSNLDYFIPSTTDIDSQFKRDKENKNN